MSIGDIQTYFTNYSDGVQVAFPNVITWAEPSTSNLSVTVDGLVATYTRSVNDITLDLVPTLGALVVIKRVSDIDTAAGFSDGLLITGGDLNTDQTQIYDLTEENRDEHRVDSFDIKRDIGDVDFTTDGDLQSQIKTLAAGSVLTQTFTVTDGPQGRFNIGDVVLAGEPLEDIIIDMLQKDTPPVFSLSGSPSFLVESGTLITPTLTPSYSANDAGPSNAYQLFKSAISIYGPVVSPLPFSDAPYAIVDQSITYHATLAHDANILPAGNLISGNVVYRGARAAFKGLTGDLVNIRSNTISNVGVTNGTNIVINGVAGTHKRMMWAIPASLGAPSALNYYNGFSNNPALGDLVTEAPQMVDDASAANPILYNVYTYTQLINFTSNDVLTLTV